MGEKSDQIKKSEEGNVDLSELSSMSLGPDWVSGKKPRTQLPGNIREDRPRGKGGARRDRRGSARPKRPGPRDGGDHGPRRHQGGPAHERAPFKPVVEVDFYPEEEPFKVLAQAIRNSYRTFELFEIARLILEKPDRWVCVVKDPEQKEGDPARLFASVPDGLPFRSEEEALAHVFRHYMDDFFTTEKVEVEPPSGSFQMVHKCGITGEFLGAPNYHRYQALCREHHASKLAHLPYSRFEQRIESSREEEDIQKWLDKMKTQTRYVVKENPEQVFTTSEDARLYLVTQSKEKLVRPAYSARFSGKALALLNPSDPIRRSVDFLHEGQMRFPLETANHLRGRLRRMHFAVYKRGSKGISFVCAVKRRFRKPDEVLADNLQELIDFLEAHPNFPAKDLPKGFLGIDPDKKKKKPASPAAREVAREVAEKIGEDSTESASVEAAATPEPTEKATEPEAREESPSGKPAGETGLTEEQKKAIQQLKVDLRYLVSEGYITEFSDGRLFVPGVREEEVRRVEKQKEEAKTTDAESKDSEDTGDQKEASEVGKTADGTDVADGSKTADGTDDTDDTDTDDSKEVENKEKKSTEDVSGAKDPESAKEPTEVKGEEPKAAKEKKPEPEPEAISAKEEEKIEESGEDLKKPDTAEQEAMEVANQERAAPQDKEPKMKTPQQPLAGDVARAPEEPPEDAEPVEDKEEDKEKPGKAVKYTEQD